MTPFSLGTLRALRNLSEQALWFASMGLGSLSRKKRICAWKIHGLRFFDGETGIFLPIYTKAIKRERAIRRRVDEIFPQAVDSV